MESKVIDLKTEGILVTGSQFKATFGANYKYFVITGYDESRDAILTKIYPNDGEPFDDEIERKVFFDALKVHKYENIFQPELPPNPEYLIQNFSGYRNSHDGKPVFDGPDCIRCTNRFGTTNTSSWCTKHYKNSKCWKFKLDK